MRHLQGEISSTDAPAAGANGSWGEGDFGRTYSLEMDFLEFARVEIWDGRSFPDPSEGQSRTWFRISDFVPWHHAFKAKYDLLLPSSTQPQWLSDHPSSGQGNLNH